MKILDAGHCYQVENLPDGSGSQMLQFIKKEGDGFPFNKGAAVGTNVQEVLRALIDRSEYLNRQIPCAETEAAIGCLKSALALYEIRAARRHGRHIEAESLQAFMCRPTCSHCGHIGCVGHPTKEPSDA